jgi:hypothetical protein
LGWNIDVAIPGIKVLQVYSDNTLGTGTLTVKTTDSIAWTNPDGSEGSAVSISNGQTVVAQGNSSTGTIVVKRTSSSDLDTTKSSKIFCDGRKCTLEKLTEIETQIENAQQAQRTGIGDEYLQRGGVEKLVEEQRRLENKYARETGERQLFTRSQIAGT